MRGWVVLFHLILGAPLILAVAAAPSFAEVDKDFMEQLVFLIEQEAPEPALALLDQTQQGEDVKTDAKALREVCEALEAAAMSTGKSDSENGLKLVDLVLGAADALVEASPGSDVCIAAARARVAHGRMLRGAGKDVNADDWLAAVDLLEQAYGHRSSDGAPLGWAVDYLTEATTIDGAEESALLERANGVVAKLVENHPDSPGALTADARMKLTMAIRTLDDDKRAAKKMIAAAIKSLAAHIEGESPNIDLCTLYNQLVTFDRLQGFKIGADYRTETRTIGMLTAEIPISTQWVVSKSGKVVRQYDSERKTLCTVLVDDYSWDTSWQFEGGEAGGDNIKGIASMAMGDRVAEFKEVHKKKGPSKGRMNKKVDKGYMYVLNGLDEDRDAVHKTRWFFKSQEGNRTTFTVQLSNWQPEVEVGPEMLAFLETIYETKKD